MTNRSYLIDNMITSEIESQSQSNSGHTLLERLGGRDTVLRVHKIFYDKIYTHPWIGQYFKHVPRDLIENQQTDFMTQLFGGPKAYSGRMPNDAHEHMMVTEELFRQRQELLAESLKEAKIPGAEAKAWMRIDGAFKKVIVKASIEECKKRFHTDTILDFQDPGLYRKAS
jgi:hemoglobin